VAGAIPEYVKGYYLNFAGCPPGIAPVTTSGVAGAIPIWRYGYTKS